ncbi:unnamed protein product [Lathyrus oleraceus]
MSLPKSVSVSAILLDSGNLVLRNRPNDDASDPLWQSFDHPTDTWLPGGKIRLDKKTYQPQFITSWKNSEDPSTCLFSLELDQKEKNSLFVGTSLKSIGQVDLGMDIILVMFPR